MSQLRGYFHPAWNPRTVGFNKEGGRFWIGLGEDLDSLGNLITIELTVWADESPCEDTFAHMRVYHESIKTIRALEEVGFLHMFESIEASTFYDVAQCCALCDIPIVYHGEDFKEMTPRKVYEILYMDEEKIQ